MKLWTAMGAEGNNLDNTIMLHKASANNGQSVSSYLVELLTGEGASE
jgi:hypothetical protein